MLRSKPTRFLCHTVLVVATAVCLLIDCPAQARAPVGESEPGRSPAGAFDHGVLWKVSGRGGEGGRPSYLFGTIHSDDPRVVQLPRQVRAAFDESDHFCMELLLDPRASSVLAQSVVFPQGQDLRAMIGGTLFEHHRAFDGRPRRAGTSVAAAETLGGAYDPEQSKAKDGPSPRSQPA